MTTNIQISAIVCTHNRSGYLKKAVQSLNDQTLPKEQYEVIVVDNASTDDTEAVVESFRHVPNLRYIYEPILGLSQARNTGWQNAKGKYIAYLDDDAIACPEWLKRILRAFETMKPTPGSVGGKVVPIWEIERPTWLPKEMEPALTIIDWSDQPIFLTESHQFLAGVNISYPRDVLEECKGFSVNLGRKGSILLSGEEYFVERYIKSMGLGVYYDPLICVQHHIPAERLTSRWLCRRYFWQGASFQIIQLLEDAAPRSRGRYLVLALRNTVFFARSPRNLAVILFPTGSQPGIKRKCRVYGNLGGIWGQMQIGLGKVVREK